MAEKTTVEKAGEALDSELQWQKMWLALLKRQLVQW
jgi:hypothetical protein